jgi:hypothetical protein
MLSGRSPNAIALPAGLSDQPLESSICFASGLLVGVCAFDKLVTDTSIKLRQKLLKQESEGNFILRELIPEYSG